MRKTRAKRTTIPVLDKVICDKCSKEMNVEHGSCYSGGEITLTAGYRSIYDTYSATYDVCDTCLGKLIQFIEKKTAKHG